MRTAIVLAGGRSARFGADKLAEDVGGRSMLAAAMSACAPLVDGLIVAGPELPVDWREAWDDAIPVALVRDTDPYAGPLTALANVLGSRVASTGEVAIVVGGDMPHLVPDVLRRMLDRLETDVSLGAVVLARPETGQGDGSNGPTQVLPMALRAESAAKAARSARSAGRRSLRALLDHLAWIELPPADWLPLDPGARTLVDIDTRADFDRLRNGKGR